VSASTTRGDDLDAAIAALNPETTSSDWRLEISSDLEADATLG
jgi:hypothetical protein